MSSSKSIRLYRSRPSDPSHPVTTLATAEDGGGPGSRVRKSLRPGPESSPVAPPSRVPVGPLHGSRYRVGVRPRGSLRRLCVTGARGGLVGSRGGVGKGRERGRATVGTVGLCVAPSVSTPDSLLEGDVVLGETGDGGPVRVVRDLGRSNRWRYRPYPSPRLPLTDRDTGRVRPTLVQPVTGRVVVSSTPSAKNTLKE